jgi:hypothetical protein
MSSFQGRDNPAAYPTPAPGAGQEENGFSFAGEAMTGVLGNFAGSPLLDTLRQRAADRHICYVHLLDSSELYGTIVWLLGKAVRGLNGGPRR